MPSKEEIESKLTLAGGYLKKDLAEWGISWPPIKGWKLKLIKDYQEGNNLKTPCSSFAQGKKVCNHSKPVAHL